MWLRWRANMVIAYLVANAGGSSFAVMANSHHKRPHYRLDTGGQEKRHNYDAAQQSMLSAIFSKARPIEEVEAEIMEQGGKPFSDRSHVPEFMRINLSDPVQRRLEDDDAGQYQNLYDFSGYSMKYAKCQPVQRFSEEAVMSGEYSSLVIDNLVIFRLCPERQCSSDLEYGCNNGYGEYAIPLQDYLSAMLNFEYNKKQNYCNFCSNCGYNFSYDDDGGRRYHGRALEEGEEDSESGDDEKENGEEDGGDDEEDGPDDEEEEAKDDEDEEAEEEDEPDEGEAEAEGEEEEDLEEEEEAAYGDNGNYENDDGGAEDAGNGDDDNADAGDDGGNDDYDYCSAYYDTCYGYENSCAEGDDDENIDYSNYVECMQVEGSSYYISPYCDASEGSIQMGIFYDPYCAHYAGSQVSINDITGVSFSKSAFAEFYEGECISCSSNENSPYYNAETTMCNELYDESARCNEYMANKVTDDEDDMDTTCGYIENIRYGTYDSSGAILTTNSLDGVPRKVTAGQVVLLVFASIACTGFALYSCFLHHEITNVLLKQLSNRGRLLPSSRGKPRGRYLSNKDPSPAGTSESGASYTSDDTKEGYVMA